MRSIFDGSESLIAEALSLNAKQSINHKSTCAALAPFPDTASRIDSLVSVLFAAIETCWQGRTPSLMNWKLRRQSSINPINNSPEVVLERAIALLGERGLLPEWYNQIPIASGLLDEKSDKRAAVDLVRMRGDTAELIELKWGSNTPAYAAFEILRYGLAFLFSYKMREGFSYQAYPLMNSHRVSLRVLAPQDYYATDLTFLQAAIGKAVERIFQEQTQGAMLADFLFLTFPHGFRLPFLTGAEVTALRDLSVDAAPIAKLLAGIEGIQPVWSAT